MPHGSGTGTRSTSAVDPHSAVAESYRSLRSALLLLPSRPRGRRGDRCRSCPPPAEDSRRAAPCATHVILLVVSASAGEGKTTSLVNLACTLAEAGRRVIVLDCDFRHPEAHLFLGVPSGRGRQRPARRRPAGPLASVLQPTAIPDVQLAPAGSSTEHPGALMGAMGRWSARPAQLADVVLIDAPPVLLANDAIDLMPFVDTVRGRRPGGPDRPRAEAERAGRAAQPDARSRASGSS